MKALGGHTRPQRQCGERLAEAPPQVMDGDIEGATSDQRGATLVAMFRTLPRLGRTLFVWSSAVTVAGCGLSALGGSQTRLMAAAPEMESFGLSYLGRSGAILACAETALVLAAWWLARGNGVLARLGGWLLVAWAALWCANGLRWLVAAPDGLSLGIFAGLLAALLCTLLATRPPRVPLGE